MLHSAKRARIENTDGTDEIQSWWKHVQALDSRVKNLESILNDKTGNHQNSGFVCTPGDTANTLERRVSNIEKSLGIVYNYPQTLEYSGQKIVCPADSCNRLYKSVEKLHSHIRESPGIGHKILVPFISQLFCNICRRGFARVQELFDHERRIHNEKYRSRIEAFVPYLWQPESKQIYIHLNIIDVN